MTKPLVYLVDDNAEFCKLMVVVFEKLGAKFEYFTAWKAYHAALAVKEPTLSLVDLDFGGQDEGFKVINYVRKEALSNHPIVVLSGKKDVHSINYALELGANDYITKPIDRPYLIAKLSQYFQTEEMQDWSDPDIDLPEGDEATITLPVELTEVDEMGVRFLTPHFVAKGTTVYLQCPVLAEIFGREKAPVMTVIDSQAIEGAGLYENYAEIAVPNEELTRNIRNWIGARTGSAAA